MEARKLGVYVAGKFGDAQWIKQNVISRIAAIPSVEITHDWTIKATQGAVLGLPRNGVPQTPEQVAFVKECAVDDIGGVQRAVVIVAVLTDPDHPYRGTWTEIGAALAEGKTVLILCPDDNSPHRGNVFFHHPRCLAFDSLHQIVHILSTVTAESRQKI